jgi:cytochrome P450
MLFYHLLPSLSQAIGGILILGFVHYVYCYYILHRSRQKLIHHLRCQPPKKYPHQDPVFGLQEASEALRAAKSKTYLQRIQKLYQEYGTTFASETLLATNVVYTIEPANIQTVLATNFKDYHVGAHRKAAISPLLGNSIILTDGELWTHSRAMFRPSFARSYVSDLPRFERHAKDLIAAIPRDGSTVNLMELFLLLTADTTTDFMFGKSIDSLKHPGNQASNFAKMFQDAQIGCEERWRLGRLANFWPNPKFWRSVKQIHAYIDTYVDTALEFRRTLVAEGKAEPPKKYNDANAVEEPYILLQELAKITDDRDTIREGLLTIFFAGRDTTASLLTNLFFMLAKHPEVWRKLRQEVDGLEGKPPSFQDLNDLKYVRWCMNECKWGP